MIFLTSFNGGMLKLWILQNVGKYISSAMLNLRILHRKAENKEDIFQINLHRYLT